MWQVDRTKGLDAWLNVIIKYAALDPDYSKMFAMEVYEKLKAGLDCVNTSGERFTFAAQGIGSVDLASLEPPGARVSVTGYSGATWYPAASCNYSTTTHSKNTLVVHTIEGTASGALSWFRNCNAQVSANYVVSEAGGVWQCVDEWQTAWHVGCANSYCIGIEHEGYAGSSSHPASLYNASALLARDVCNRWGIAKQHNTCPPGILGHVDINNCVCGGSHWDPGGGWDWAYYIQQVTGTPPTPQWAAAYHAQSYPSTMTAGTTAIAWVEYTNTGTGTWTHSNTRLGTSSPQDRSSPFYNSANWIGANRPTDVDQSSTAQGAVGRFTFILKAPDSPGTYVEHYKPVQEGAAWFGDEITWTITVNATNGNITGTVRNAANSQALAGATVAVTGGPSTTTDSAGSYTFANIGAGTYTVTASKAGFAPVGDSVSVTAGQTTTHNFNLTSTDNTPPTAPSGLSATSISASEIDLSWTGSTDSGGSGLAGYIIYRNGAEVGRTASTTYADNGLAQNTSYSYYVKAYDQAANVSAASNTATASTQPGTVAVFQDGFPNLNGWTADVVADGSTRGVGWDTSHNHGTFSGSGNAVTAVGAGADPGKNGCWSYKSFPRPFAAGRYDGWFYDNASSNNSRQGIHLRGYSGTTLAFSIYIGTYSATSYANYSVGIYSLGNAWVWTTVAPRSAGWHKFSIEFLPYTGSSDMKFYVDDALKYTTNRPSATNTYGISRTYLGHNYNINQASWFDDLGFYAQPPVPPTMTSPTATTTSIDWHYTDNSNNEAGFDLHDDAQTAKGTAGMNTNHIAESGLVPNTAYTRHMHAYNGTLNSLPSSPVTGWTLSVPPSAANVTCDHASGSSTFTFTAVGGFGAGTVAKYLCAWDSSPTHTWTGSESTWNSGALITTASAGSYYLHVKGYNGGDVANGTLDLGPYAFDDTPPTNPTSVTEIHGAPNGEWQSTDSIPAFTWSGASDASGIAGYEVYFGTDEGAEAGTYQTSAAYTGAAVDTGTYYLRVRAKDNAGNFADEWDTLFTFQFDSSAPDAPAVSDDGDYSGSATRLHASWFATDPDSGIAEYQYAVGTSAGAADVVDWTSAGAEAEAVISIPDPGMAAGTTYFISVKAVNGAGAASPPGSSDGIQLAPDAGTISAAKALADGSPVGLVGKVVTASFNAGFYIEESNRTSGIQVLGPGPGQGALVTVGGTVGVNALGERAILDPAVITEAEPDPARIPGALFVTNSALGGSAFNAYTAGKAGGAGLNNVGLLVKVCGTVLSVDDNGFTITDGSACGAISVVTSQIGGISVAEGDYVSVVGVCALELDPLLKPRIRVRGVEDVRKLN